MQHPSLPRRSAQIDPWRIPEGPVAHGLSRTSKGGSYKDFQVRDPIEQLFPRDFFNSYEFAHARAADSGPGVDVEAGSPDTSDAGASEAGASDLGSACLQDSFASLQEQEGIDSDLEVLFVSPPWGYSIGTQKVSMM